LNTLADAPSQVAAIAVQEVASLSQAGRTALDEQLDYGIENVLVKLTASEILAISESLSRMHSVPAMYDRRVLASCRTAVGRDLIMDEKKLMRIRLAVAVEKRASQAG
jgi:hypothetical protein